MNEDEKETFSTGAIRRKIEPSRVDLIPTEAIIALGERYHYGATIRNYGEWNWSKGIPYHNLILHAQIHLSELGNQLTVTGPLGPVASDDYHRGNAAAVMWAMAAIIHFLKFGNPAEEKK